jgi:hypothetical protein
VSIYKSMDIEAEERPALHPPRTAEEWRQEAATFAVAEQVGAGIPCGVDWSALALGEPERIVDDGFIEAKVAFRPWFPPPEDLNQIVAALDDERSRLTRASWGTMRLGDPVIRAALDECKRAETMRGVFPNYPYACPGCVDAGNPAPYEWAGALFVHLITCHHFAEKINHVL